MRCLPIPITDLLPSSLLHWRRIGYAGSVFDTVHLFEAVLIRKKDPDNWRHVFSIIYYGFGDANRYPYYSKVEK